MSKPKTGEFSRELIITQREIDVDGRTVELAFSSEEPYERYFGTEVLGHRKSEVDLSRIGSGTHPLLLQHDPEKQIGVVESARVDSDKVGRAMVRFSKSALGEEIFQDVIDGIRSLASVGYEVHEWVEMCRGEDEGIFRAVSWTPYEISIVSIPADATVGVGRQTHPIKRKIQCARKFSPLTVKIRLGPGLSVR